LGAAAISLVDGFVHRLGTTIRIEKGATFDVTRTAADRLNERSGTAEITFLVGVENGNERDFGKIEAFSKQVDANENVEFSAAQVAQNFDAIEGFDFGMQIAATHADFREIFAEVFGHAFGERSNKDAFILFSANANFFEQIVDLSFDGANFDLRI